MLGSFVAVQRFDVEADDHYARAYPLGPGQR
jgi:hypothetical protein